MSYQFRYTNARLSGQEVRLSPAVVIHRNKPSVHLNKKNLLASTNFKKFIYNERFGKRMFKIIDR